MLYHITTPVNLPSVMQHGLRCDGHGGFTRTTHVDRIARLYGGTRPVFLTSDPTRLVAAQLTRSWVMQRKPVVLSVDVSDCCVEEHIGAPISNLEFVVRHAINSERLKNAGMIVWNDTQPHWCVN